MTPPPPRSTRPDPLFPFTTLFRSPRGAAAPRRPRRHRIVGGARLRRRGEGDRSRPDGRGGARPRGPRAATHIGGGGAGARARLRGDSHLRKIPHTLPPPGRALLLPSPVLPRAGLLLRTAPPAPPGTTLIPAAGPPAFAHPDTPSQNR